MDEVAKWFSQNLWAGLAYIAAGSFLIVLSLILLMNRSRSSAAEVLDDVVNITRDGRQFLLFCGDAKALADLAIQRNMLNSEFLRRLQAQPCYDALTPHLGEEFLSMVTLHQNDARGSTLAVLFHKEIERLERERSAKDE